MSLPNNTRGSKPSHPRGPRRDAPKKGQRGSPSNRGASGRAHGVQKQLLADNRSQGNAA